MKLLMFYCPKFHSIPYERVLSLAGEKACEVDVKDAVVVFYQLEQRDEQQRKKILNKALKNIKWLAGKFNTKKVVLHSFNHLSTSKASPEFAIEFVKDLVARLQNTEYRVLETPFGWLNGWTMSVAGESLAKVFKDL